ncbi:hypothetical protein [Mesorhizobium muleiense]|uniref:hypothetical protein n=1 Tax=Mesorhizobium muleiense TaxID=1004279 RepID=UPI001F206CB6|nr:hypothetical protein [Mesorhizobium muleiense]MCF6113416.1 hypothetical protein [Mesorhizobium muleiense]
MLSLMRPVCILTAAVCISPAYSQQKPGPDLPNVKVLEALPPHLNARVLRQEQIVLPPGAGQELRAIYEQAKLWSPGSSLLVCFMGGRQELRARIAVAAQEWTRWGNVQLNFGNVNNPVVCGPGAVYDIRIGFGYDGYWSLVGRDSINLADQYEQSMNLEGYDIVPPSEPEFSQVVLHEFGHALGLHHEHQNPLASCEEEFDWNTIYQYLAGHPNYWSKETVDFNLRRLVDDGRYTTVGEFDADSIMLYRFDAWMYKSKEQSPCYIAKDNVILSDGDQTSIRDAYPTVNVGAQLADRGSDIEKLRAELKAAPIDAQTLTQALDQLNAIVSPDLSITSRRSITDRLMAPRQ